MNGIQKEETANALVEIGAGSSVFVEDLELVQ
jgi:hypothetical protein